MSSPSCTTAPAEKAKDTRIEWLRGTAAFAVLVLHLTVAIGPSGAEIWSAFYSVATWLWLGVPVFFVVSGTCVGQAWLKGPPLGDFLKRRFVRIYPAYLASLIVCAIPPLVRKASTGINDVYRLPESFVELLATLCLATDPASTVPRVNWVYWTLSCEVVFYGLVGTLLFFRPPARRPTVWLALHVFLVGLDLAGASHAQTPTFFIESWGSFALGVGVALQRSGLRGFRPSIAVSIIHFIGLALMGRFGLGHATAALTACVLLIPARFWRPSPECLACRLGLISYSLYLIHVPVGVFLVVMPLLKATGRGLITNTALLLCGVLASLLAGVVFHRLAERPWLQYLERSRSLSRSCRPDGSPKIARS